MSAVLAPVAQCCGNCGNGSKNARGFIICPQLKPSDWMTERAPCPVSKWIPITKSTEARRAAQEGINRAVAAAERESEGWAETAFLYVKLYATLNRGKLVIGHDIVQASVNDRIIQPPNARAWGGPLKRAAQCGYIAREGTAEDPNRHGNPVPRWRMVGA